MMLVALICSTFVAAIGFGIAFTEALNGDERADFRRMLIGTLLVTLGVTGMVLSASAL